MSQYTHVTDRRMTTDDDRQRVIGIAIVAVANGHARRAVVSECIFHVVSTDI